MNIAACMLFVLVGAVDVLIVGISYGVKQTNITALHNVIISIIAGIGTYAAMLLGHLISGLVSPHIGNWIGGGILFILGGKQLIDSYRKKNGFIEQVKTDPQAIDINHSGKIELLEILILAAVLSINNIGLGIGASLAELNIYCISILSVMVSMIFLKIGVFTGKILKGKLFLKYADEISGIIILILGLYLVIL